MTLLNLDAGERDDETSELWRLFDIVNIACGGHAGDIASMRRVVAACRGVRPRAGAHPSYPDREQFGRRTLAIDPVALAVSVAAQCSALVEIAREAGVALGSIKPHGALYHDADRDEALARAVLEGAVAALGAVTVIGPPGGALSAVASALGLAYLREAFADRGTRADGTLIPRGEPGALVLDPALAAASAVVLAPTADTLCIHGDTPNALAIARAVRAAIDAS